MASSALETLKKAQHIRKREVYLPISQVSCLCTPLTVGDDLVLKTMITSPDVYDYELCSLLYRHTEFPSSPKKVTFDDFLDYVADFDRKVLLWGIFTATYTDFGKHEITCPNCSHKWEEKIYSEDILHAEFIQVWDKEEKFHKFTYPIEFNTDDENDIITKYVFNSKIPSMRDHIQALKMISNEKLKENFDKFNGLLSKNDDMAMITKSIEIFYKDENGIEHSEAVEKPNEIHNAISQYLSFNILDKVAEEYTNEINKYRPEFKKFFACSNCSHEFNFPIDVEVSLFKKFFRIDDQ